MKKNTGLFYLAIAFLLGLLPSISAAQMKARVAWTSFASNMSGAWVAQPKGSR